MLAPMVEIATKPVNDEVSRLTFGVRRPRAILSSHG